MPGEKAIIFKARYVTGRHMDVDAAGISVKVRALYPERSAILNPAMCHCRREASGWDCGSQPRAWGGAEGLLDVSRVTGVGTLRLDIMAYPNAHLVKGSARADSEARLGKAAGYTDGAGKDAVFVDKVTVSGLIDLGDGTKAFTITSGGTVDGPLLTGFVDDSVTVANGFVVEGSINLGAGNDTLSLINRGKADEIGGGMGADKLHIDDFTGIITQHAGVNPDIAGKLDVSEMDVISARARWLPGLTLSLGTGKERRETEKTLPSLSELGEAFYLVAGEYTSDEQGEAFTADGDDGPDVLLICRATVGDRPSELEAVVLIGVGPSRLR